MNERKSKQVHLLILRSNATHNEWQGRHYIHTCTLIWFKNEHNYKNITPKFPVGLPICIFFHNNKFLLNSKVSNLTERRSRNFPLVSTPIRCLNYLQTNWAYMLFITIFNYSTLYYGNILIIVMNSL